MGIYFTQIRTSGLKNGRNAAKRWLGSVIKAEKYHLGDIVIAFCTDDYMVNANKKFLQHDYPTDIITFDQSTAEERTNKLISGDLLISIERVRANAKLYGVPSEEEIHRVMVHGLLHLIGYDDTTPKLQKQMRAREDLYLKRRKQTV